jgi:hypothetical protein
MKPNYFLQFEIYGSAFLLNVNDIRIIQNKKGQGISLKFPINPYIFNGYNELDIFLTPAYQKITLDEDSKCKLSVFFVDENDSENKQVEIISLTVPDFNTQKPNYSYENKLKFEVSVPFKDSLWVRSPDLRTYPNILQLLINKYKSIYEILLKKDLNEMLALLTIQQKELADCLYVSEKEALRNNIEIFEDHFNNSDWVLSNFEEELTEIKYYAYGKLVRLEDAKGESPLKYRDEVNKFTSSFEFLFCVHPDNGKLVIIR